jgi:lysozyme family protein
MDKHANFCEVKCRSHDDQGFEHAIGKVLGHEGGYVNDASDRGGETKYGISKRTYPDLDIKSLTREQAKAIYRRDFWERYKYCQIGDQVISAKLLDLSINMGPNSAHRLLQRALKANGCSDIKEDGIIGRMTLAAVNRVDASALLAAIRSEAAGYYRLIVASKPDQNKFLQGWLNRAYA